MEKWEKLSLHIVDFGLQTASTDWIIGLIFMENLCRFNYSL